MAIEAERIWSNEPAEVWAEGYPVGNGRLGAMVLGDPLRERLALNHDRLWRRYWKHYDHGLKDIFPEFQRLCLERNWDEAVKLMKNRVALQGNCIYVNPFVPVGDLGIYPSHVCDERPRDYGRTLDLKNGIVEVAYSVGDLDFRRECLASWPAGVIAVNMTASRTACVSGEVSLYRLLDRECEIAGSAGLDELVMEGRFDEG
ncbi:MAG: glycoside hydrolase N-terminal domain-containing protein, partial [Kiritimatiellia bacterium]|nr:glycoside hydrolase N-terminal domain-containing protein [Kiritimatiellia bacterium]